MSKSVYADAAVFKMCATTSQSLLMLGELYCFNYPVKVIIMSNKLSYWGFCKGKGYPET